MQRNAVALCSSVLAGLFAQAILPTAPAMAADDGKCTAFAAKTIGDATIEHADLVSTGSYQPQGGAAISGLPAFCHLSGVAKPTARSSIHFEVWMPLGGWSGRIDMIGNGGYSPAINMNQLAALLRAGSVAVGTDTGHTGRPTDMTFGDDNDEAIADWGYRSVHESIIPTKTLVTTFYGKPAQHTYFLGCSTGGHQGLVEAQRYPDDFDGILAGDPANNRTNLNLSFVWRFLAAHPQGDNTHTILSIDDLKRVNRAAMAQCDAADGVRDGVMANPLACHFDVASLRCAPGKTPATGECLDDKQIEALQKIYGPTKRRDNGQEIYTGWVVGSEWVDGAGGLYSYWADSEKPDQPMRAEYFRGWVFHDPKWNWWNFDWAKDVDTARARMAPMADMNDTDMSAFRKHGGKLIVYQGWVDPIVSALDTAAYFTKLGQTNPNAADFTRLFMVPGMGHCQNGPGATNFTFAMNTDAEHDAVLALHRWVEQGTAPNRIVATRYKERTPASGVAMTRPLCAWPQVPTYSGKGSTDDASNFQCR